ncbi:hypothetical protein HPB48_009497 [Haemaphysalis longicornis]|uniref:Cullin family profile domain-containing protein n=1 Tax=Haemaphysalis longicornis TaxID=44386 RepID=A0A9J6GGH6_HAELO|nr:hypothetical protein HPB48_009497 [Haemaphysalis longicornis]
MVEQRLAEEERRVEQYLHASTLEPLMSTCRDVLIKKHLGEFYGELKNFLVNDRIEELTRAYRLLLPVPDGFDQLRTLFQEHVWTQGLDAIECLGRLGAPDPKLYVDTVLQVHEKYSTLVVTALGGDTSFFACFDKACTKFINENAVTHLAHSSRKSAELLARYCHMLLKKDLENVEYSEREDKLCKAMMVFGYLKDKDVFQKFYSRMLAKRLVEHSSACRDLEASMISKLKLANGYEYVSTLERMLQDNALSENVTQEFLRSVKDSGITWG